MLSWPLIIRSFLSYKIQHAFLGIPQDKEIIGYPQNPAQKGVSSGHGIWKWSLTPQGFMHKAWVVFMSSYVFMTSTWEESCKKIILLYIWYFPQKRLIV